MTTIRYGSSVTSYILSKRPAPSRAELVLMALDGKVPCCECGDPCVPDDLIGKYLCEDCYKEWMDGSNELDDW